MPGTRNFSNCPGDTPCVKYVNNNLMYTQKMVNKGKILSNAMSLIWNPSHDTHTSIYSVKYGTCIPTKIQLGNLPGQHALRCFTEKSFNFDTEKDNNIDVSIFGYHFTSLFPLVFI